MVKPMLHWSIFAVLWVAVRKESISKNQRVVQNGYDNNHSIDKCLVI